MGHDGPVPQIRPPAFVARERELAALAAALSAGPALVLVTGEAGVGKSRLLQEFLASPDHSHLRPLVAACPPFRVPHTLGPVVDALRAATERVGGLRLSPLAGALRPLFPEWAADLPPPPEPLEDPGAARHRLFRAVAELLRALHVDVLVVEDAHWADEATLEFLLFLVTGQHRLGMVVTYRPEDLPADSLLPRLASRPAPGMPLLRLDLSPLDVADIADLVSSMLDGERVSAGFATFLHDHTGGVPLVVEESVRLMGDRADLVRRDGGWVRRSLDEIDVPPTVRDAVLERFRRLGPDAQRLLRAAAVLAEPADDTLLVAVADLPPERLATGLAEALHSGLLREDQRGRLAFRHALAARAVHEDTPRPERHAAHLRAARALQAGSPPPVARLAHHYREAGRIVEWSRYAEQAADLALATADEATAADLLHDLLTTADLPAGDVARLVDKLPAGPITGTSRCLDLVRTVRSALAVDGLPSEHEGELRFQLGRLLNLVNEYVESHAQTTRAVAHLTHDPVMAARAMGVLSRPRATHATAAEHLDWLRRAGELTAAMSPAQNLAFTMTRTEVLLMLSEQTGWQLAEDVLATPPEAISRETAIRAHLNIGDAAMRWGRYAQAERLLDTAHGLVDPDQYPYVRDMIEASRHHLAWFTGRWGDLAEQVTALAGRQDDDMPAFLSELSLVTGLLAAARGDRGRAADHLATAVAMERRSGAPEFYVEPAGALARLHLDAGRVDEALAVTDEPVDILTRKGVWLWAVDLVPVRVEALLAAGRRGEAADLVAAFTVGLGDRDIPSSRAALATCHAVLAGQSGDPATAADGFARAAEAWEALPRPYDALLARERQAGHLLAAGRTDAAVALLTDVHAGLSALGATVAADRVAGTLRPLGIDPARRRRRRGHGNELTPRELDVVRLVATGRTNREIGEALALSPKTVAHHVDAAMRKLGVSSRTAVAVRAIEAGVLPLDGDAGS